jgi:hypothetical protein
VVESTEICLIGTAEIGRREMLNQYWGRICYVPETRYKIKQLRLLGNLMLCCSKVTYSRSL